MFYTQNLKYHYKPKKGWINDPNGLVYFDGYYHVFYQHTPDFEVPWKEPCHWGHCRTKDFIEWEELPVALYPDQPYDCSGCWSGTAIVKDDTLYLFYASIRKNPGSDVKIQTVSVAYSKDGINFEKYDKNPVIDNYPADGGPDFRDPAITCIDGKYFCIMATGNPETQTGRLLLYESKNLFDWNYNGIMEQWENSKFTECPSVMEKGDKLLVSASVCPIDATPYFRVMYGNFQNGNFTSELIGDFDKGPDQYAGQIFKDDKGRCILITWIPGWDYIGYVAKDVGCMSVPREIIIKNGKMLSYPVEEVRHLLQESDPAVKITDDGFEIERRNREKVIYNGEIQDIKIIRDGYVMEVFVNRGESVYTILL